MLKSIVMVVFALLSFGARCDEFEYDASPMNMTRLMWRRERGILVLNQVEDKEIPRRVVAVRVAPPTSQGVKVKVVDRNTLRVHLDATEGMYDDDDDTIRTMKRKKSPIFSLVFGTYCVFMLSTEITSNGISTLRMMYARYSQDSESNR